MTWLSVDDCNLDDFIAHRAAAKAADQPLKWAAEVTKDLPIYDCAALAAPLAGSERMAVLKEWHHVLGHGAGAIILKGALSDHSAIDAASEVFDQITAEERAAGASGADHFAKSGANARIWNALQKLCLRAPDVFARYYGNVFVAAACDAWLGPNWQMTSQTNLVNPGGEGQTAHRDYHLGFQTGDVAAAYPAVVHQLSPYLTLQGGIAHVDMSVESGPTKLLPYSQSYLPGYLAYRRPEFAAYFEEEFVQLPLAKGDAVFFNPATFHGAGSNVTKDVARLVNLLQVSSAFGIAMEAIDRAAMCRALYPVLLRGDLSAAEQAAAVASCAQGYSFPTNIDTDPPVGGLAPKTQAALMNECLAEGLSAQAFEAALAKQEARRPA